MNVNFWILNFLCSYDSFKNDISLSVIWVIHNSRAIYQVDSLCKTNVLPNFGLSGHRSYFTNLFLPQSVDHWAFTNIWISNKSYSNILLVFVEIIKLSQKLDQWSFTEWIFNWSSKSKSWVFFWQNLNPFLSHWSWNKIAFVQNQNHVLWRTIFLYMLFNMLCSCSHGISSIDNLYNNIRRI